MQFNLKETPFNFDKNLLGGQSFLWRKVSYENNLISYLGVFSKQFVQINVKENVFHVKGQCVSHTKCNYETLLGLSADYTKTLSSLSKTDAFLAEAIKSHYGLRILHQPVEDLIFTFILSANNNIKKIRKTTFQLIENFGTPAVINDKNIKLFPDKNTLANLTETQIRAHTSAGFRAKYLIETAKLLRSIPIKEITINPQQLKQLPGVGDKIADCVLVFSGLRSDIYPVDVWTKRILSKLYSVEYTQYNDYRKWFQDKFGNNASLAGHFLFEHYKNII